MRPLKITPGHAITGLALAPDGQRLGVVQYSHGFRLFDALTGAELGHDTGRDRLSEESPTGRHSMYADRLEVRLAEVTAGRPFLRFQTGWTRTGDFNRPPDAPVTSALQLVTALHQKPLTPRGKLIPPNYPRPKRPFRMFNCALSADHRYAAGGEVVLDLASEMALALLDLSGPEPGAVYGRTVFSPDETRVVVASPHALLVFDLPLEFGDPQKVSPTVVHVTRPQPDLGVPPFAVLPCGQKVLVRGTKSRIELRDLNTGEVLTVWKWGLPKVNALAVAGDGLTAAAGGTGGRVMLWDLG
jgi:hypothetical protein